MPMKLPHVLLLLIVASTAIARDFRPEGYLENIPASDSSVQECYVFRTTAGVRYTVQFSNDLTTWTDQDEIYGFGNEYVVTMRQFTAPPVLEPGEPPLPPPGPDPTINASIRMDTHTGPLGGTVVSWASLDHGGPVVVRIAGEMAPEWMQVPMYCNSFGAFAFFVWHPGSVETAPVENPILGTNDSAMLAVLEASLPTMNEEMITSVARTRNTPPPAPANPDSKRFWRILVNPDIDTDMDGSPDWAEFEIAAENQATPPNGEGGSTASGNTYNSDTNNDGIPDGDQLDRDGDGTPDSKDPDSNDNTTFFPIGPIPRYALFEIPGNALQINDLGTVVYADKTWKGGVITALPAGPAGLASARGINDLDVIIGTEGRNPEWPAIPESLSGKICFWPSPSQPYQYIQVVEGEKTVFAYRHHDGFGNQGPASILSSSGHFIAHGNDFNAELELEIGDLYDYAPTVWQIPTGGASANRYLAPPWARYVNSPSLMWGVVFPSNALQGAVYAPSALPNLPFAAFNVISQPLPTGGTVLFATPPADLTHSTGGRTTQVYVDGNWRENKVFANAIDIAGDGTALGGNNPGVVAPILIGNEWIRLETTTPGLPAPWLDSTVKLLDTTPRGWILAKRGNYPEPDFDNAVMLPIRVEGRFIGSDLIARTTAVGVDDFSIRSYLPGDTVQDRIWIMAPMGEDKRIVFKTPLNDKTPMVISADGIGFPFFPTATLNVNEAPFDIRAQPSGVSGRETTLDLKMGPEESSVTSLSKPVGIKVMKDRTVNVSVYKISRKRPSGTVVPPDADILPTQTALQNHLNDLYNPQINVNFNVTLNDAVIDVDWDVNLDDRLNNAPDVNQHSPDQQAIVTATAGDTTPVNIKVFIVSSGVPLSSGGDAYGITCRTQRTCWVLGSKMLKNNSTQFVIDTISHELGHVFVGYGHPNENGLKGPAPLPDTKHIQRLMCSGGISNMGSRLLVKGEWDEAENWLKEEDLRTGQ